MSSIDIVIIIVVLVIVVIVVVNVGIIVVIVRIWSWDGGNLLVGSFGIGFFEGKSSVSCYLLIILHRLLAIFYLEHDWRVQVVIVYDRFASHAGSIPYISPGSIQILAINSSHPL